LLVADSGPLIGLSIIDAVGLLPRLYREVMVPPAVLGEVVGAASYLPGADLLRKAPWLRVRELRHAADPLLPAFLGPGEVEAISLACENPGALLLIDDYRARRVAEAMRLTITGTAGVLVRAKKEGLIEAVLPLLNGMRQGGYYLSDKVIEAARLKAGE
jgi:predicted nucleic acid-binding protein